MTTTIISKKDISNKGKNSLLDLPLKEASQYAKELQANRNDQPFWSFYQDFQKTKNRFDKFVSVRPTPK